MTAKSALFVAVLLLASAGVAGCSDSKADADSNSDRAAAQSAPTDANPDDFCAALTRLFDDLSEVTGSTQARQDQALDRVREWGAELREVGTPPSMPTAARQGFDLTLEMIDRLPERAADIDPDELGDDLTTEERTASEAFDDYVVQTCPVT